LCPISIASEFAFVRQRRQLAEVALAREICPSRASEPDAMTPLIDRQSICLSSRELTVVVLPEAGARIYSIRHRSLGRELLWQNPGVPPARVPGGRSYDDNWCGGWDDVLPNDEPASVLGLTLPDHGEMWSAVFDVKAQARDHVRLRAQCRTAGFDVEKAIWVEDEAIRIRYSVENRSGRAMPFMWKLHPAVRLAPGDRIYIPARRFRLEPASLGSLVDAGMSGIWPLVQTPNRTVDLSCVPPPEAQELFFVYALDLVQGACGVYRPSDRSLCVWSFPKHLFTACMLFASYGGWQGHYVAVLEPTTAWPFRLEEAIAAGTYSSLATGARLEAEIRFEVRHGVEYPGFPPAG
jgi:galactose mutarotase-like enzyme